MRDLRYSISFFDNIGVTKWLSVYIFAIIGRTNRFFVDLLYIYIRLSSIFFKLLCYIN